MKSGSTLFVTLAALFTVRPDDATAAVCQMNSVDDCILLSGIRQLQQNNPTAYCLEGPRRVKTIYDCMAACQFAPNYNFTQTIAMVDSYCLGVDSQCSSISERYNNFTGCYDGGLSTIVNNITQLFNNPSSELYYNCRKLAWGRNCQLNLAGSCSYLKTLQSTDLSSDYLTVVAFYMCGAESGEFEFTDNRLCSNMTDTVVNGQCDVMCDISGATSVADICGVLQTQAFCITANTFGCSSTQRYFVAPRVTSYWAANELLGCNIQINGVTVRAQNSQCSIGSLLSACFNLSASGFGSLDGIKQLLTMQFSLSQICNMLRNSTVSSSQLLRQCVVAMMTCQVPQGQVYNWPALDAPVEIYADAKYRPLLGPFAVNAWGLSTLLSNIELFTCQATGHVQCATTPTRKSPTTTVPTTTTTTTTATTTATAMPTRRLTPTPSQSSQRVTPTPTPSLVRTTPKTANNV